MEKNSPKSFGPLQLTLAHCTIKSFEDSLHLARNRYLQHLRVFSLQAPPRSGWRGLAVEWYESQLLLSQWLPLLFFLSSLYCCCCCFCWWWWWFWWRCSLCHPIGHVVSRRFEVLCIAKVSTGGSAPVFGTPFRCMRCTMSAPRCQHGDVWCSEAYMKK